MEIDEIEDVSEIESIVILNQSRIKINTDFMFVSSEENRQRFQAFYLIPFDKQLMSPEQLFLTTLTPSHKDMKETPRKRPREPPNSATREVQG